MNENILIVDDEADIRNLVSGIIEDEGYKPRQADSAKRAYEEIDRALPDLVILDIWLHGSEHDGLQILSTIKKRHPHLPVIMISGHGTIETAVTSIKQGAYDFIEKPFKSDRLLMMMRRALENAALKQENENLKKKTSKPAVMEGEAPATENLRQLLERVATTNSRVFLTGDPGTGKDIAARIIHDLSPRASRPFMVINCATLRPERLEAELFGSDEAGNEAPGVFEQANKGTVLLDEVSDMPLETQSKIMRVLQEQKFLRVQGQREIETDVRIIASTNKNLEKSIAEGKFRQDLFYRLNVVPINVPPLRERIQDLPTLLEHFVKDISSQSGLPPRRFSAQALSAMQTYAWPGNIRQLKNVVEWAMIMNTAKAQGEFGINDLPPEITGRASPMESADNTGSNFMLLPLREAREIFEREYLQSQINRFGGNISKTAQFIGMERSALHRKLKSLQLVGDKGDEGETESDNVTSIKQKRA